MYSKYDDPTYRPAPGERERERIKWLRMEIKSMRERIRAHEEEIERLSRKPNVFDTPLPLEF